MIHLNRIIFINTVFYIFVVFLTTGCGNNNLKNDKEVSQKIKMETASDNEAMQLVCRGQAEPVRTFKYRLGIGQTFYRYLVTEGDHVRMGQQLFDSGSLDLMAKCDELNRMKISIWDRQQRLTNMDWKINELEREITEIYLKNNQTEVKGISSTDPVSERHHSEISRIVTAKNRELDLLKQENKILAGIVSEDHVISKSIEELNREIKQEVINLRFCSPFDGRVIYLAENAERLSPGEVLIEIWDESKIVINIKVWQNQLQFISKGQIVEVQPDLFEGIFLKGIIQSVISSPEMRINNGNPEYSVKVALEDGSGKIKPGMTVSVNINLNRAEKKVSLK